MAPHSSTLAWKIPWTEEPGGLHSMGSRRVGHDWAPSLSLFTFMHWRKKWQPTPVFLPGESQGRGAWWAAVYGVAQSRTRLKQLSSSSSSSWFKSENFQTYSTTYNKQLNLKTQSYIKQIATAAKSLQSCPTLCDPIDGSPPGFPVPGTLQARTLEWVAISFSNA